MTEPFSPESVVLPEFCAEWHLYAHGVHLQKRAYVASELRRLDRAGAALLCPVLALLDGEVQQIAVEMLDNNSDGDGRAICDPPRPWVLRLVEGGKPPKKDPQGRMVPEAKRGKVLVAKTGNLGGNLGPSADAAEVAMYSGEARRAMAQQGRNLYRTVEITREGTAMTLADAIKVLRQWGVGVSSKPYRRDDTWRPASDAEPVSGQLLWLVEEVVPVRTQPVKADTSSPATSARRSAA